MNKNKLNIGLLINDIDMPYQNSLFKQFLDIINETGHHLFLLSNKNASSKNSKENIFEIASKSNDIKNADGLIIFADAFDDPHAQESFNRFFSNFKNKPMVSLSKRLEDISSIVVDNTNGMKELIDHLIIDHNYKKFAFIKGPEFNYDADERFNAFVCTLNEHRISIDDELVIKGDFTFKSGYSAVELLLDKNADFDVIVSANDLMALGAIEALNKNGIFVPFSKAITGFDGIEIKWYSMLPLTTVSQPMVKLAHTAMSVLIDKICGHPTPDFIKLPTSLAIKESCGCFSNNHNHDVKERHKEELSENIYKLRKTMIGFIQAISHTIEARDPYTAGHQKRVSNLARCIAQELNLSPDQIESIRMAALIHDLGKIFVPAEILNKPGELQVNEFNLIKDHPGSGHNILKDIDFPWPVADIILQHHEKIDGSGYPKGLKNKEIMLEAKILCVADVVEAISSHRPYRPSLGITAALEEVNKYRGEHFDEDVVDACIELFKKNKIDWE